MRLSPVALVLLLAGCDSAPAAEDGGATRDGGRDAAPIDAAPVDAADPPTDAPVDAWSPPPVACVPRARCGACDEGETCGGGGVLDACGTRACTHYVSASATATTFADCTDSATPCTLAAANAGARAGDVVCLLGGDYRDTPVAPTASGSADAPIVFRAADPAARPVLRNGRPAIALTNVSFVEVDGIDVMGNGVSHPSGVTWFFQLTNADDCWIRNSTFERATGYTGSRVDEASARARITGCTYPDAGPRATTGNASTHPADALDARGTSMLIADNDFGDVSHAALTVWIADGRSVVRGNDIHNRLHASVILLSVDGSTGRLLLEDNRIHDTGIDYEENPTERSRTHATSYDDGMVWGRQATIQLVAAGVLLRRNELVRGGRGLFASGYTNSETGLDMLSVHLRVAHNTFHDNLTHLMVVSDFAAGGPPFDDIAIANNLFGSFGLRHVHGSSIPADVTRVVSNGFADGDRFRWIGFPAGDRSLEAIEAAYPAWLDNEVMSPGFVDGDARDFALAPSSTAIDAAAPLTRVTASTPADAGTVLTVEDAWWFSDGWGIPGVAGDVIQTSDGALLHVTAVDVAASTVTVAETVSLAAGAGLGYPYAGDGADLGAHEHCP